MYKRLMKVTGTGETVEMRPSTYGNGLFASVAAAKGEVLFKIQRKLALIIDYNKGVDVSANGSWPRLQSGLQSEGDPLPWDLLLALALLDGMAGDGGEFWQVYCQAILPAPDSLTLPMCWGPALLAELQHEAISGAAVQQQERLRDMFPDLMEPIGPGLPSWFQWAFACVRSRAFKLGEECFGFVPFMDLANHVVEPNADFRVSQDGAWVEVVALKDIQLGQEVTFSYAGPEGFTNQRFMAQYGFVLPGGNPGDRLEFDIPKGSAPLVMDYVQKAIGDNMFTLAISAQDPYLYAALQSVPLVDQADSSTSGGAAAPEGDGSGAPGKALAGELLKQCDDLLKAFPTTMEDDVSVINALKAKLSAPAPPAGDDEAQAAAQGQQLLLSAVLYRYERKRLIRTCRAVLNAYSKL